MKEINTFTFFSSILLVLISPCGFAVAEEAQIRQREDEERDRGWVRRVGQGWAVAPTCWCLGLSVRPCRICRLSRQVAGGPLGEVEPVPTALPDTLPSSGHSSASGPTPSSPPLRRSGRVRRATDHYQSVDFRK